MSARQVIACDGCGDYGKDIEMTPIVVGDRKLDGCPSCTAKVAAIMMPPIPIDDNPMTKGPGQFWPDRRNG